MIRNRTLFAAARLLLGAFLFAHAMVSAHVYARVAHAPDQISDAAVHAAMPERHCEQIQPDPALLLCKHHCQSAIQTLDHPQPGVHALPDMAVLQVPLAEPAMLRKPLWDKAFRPDPTHHGGSPPVYSSTSRLRI